MDLTFIGVAFLVIGGVGLRFPLGLPASIRRSWPGLVAVIGIIVCLAAATLQGMTLAVLYAAAGFGALAAVGFADRPRRAVGTAVAVFGVALLGSLYGGLFFAAQSVAPGAGVLLLTFAVAVGAAFSLAGRLALAGSVAAVLSSAVALLLTVGLHRPAFEGELRWGVDASLRIQGMSARLLSDPEVGPSSGLLVLGRSDAGLLALLAGLVLACIALWPRRRGLFSLLGMGLAGAALALVVLAGLALPLEGGAQEIVAGLIQRGQLPMTAIESVRLDLATALPSLAALAAVVGLVDGSLAARTSGMSVDSAVDLGAFLIVGLLVLGAVLAVWRELWGSDLGVATPPLLLAAALAVLALRLWFVAPSRVAWLGGLVLWFGATQLPSGLLAGLG